MLNELFKKKNIHPRPFHFVVLLMDLYFIIIIIIYLKYFRNLTLKICI